MPSFLLLCPSGTQHFIQSKASIEASLSRLMVATQQVGGGLFIKDG
jgi:hypothetical protein